MSRRTPGSNRPLDTSSTPTDSESAPLGIKIIVALYGIEALFIFPVTLGVLASSRPLSGPVGLFLVALLAIVFLIGYGLLKFRWYGWLGALGFEAIFVLFDIATGNLLGLLISGLIVYYLLRKTALYFDEPDLDYA